MFYALNGLLKFIAVTEIFYEWCKEGDPDFSDNTLCAEVMEDWDWPNMHTREDIKAAFEKWWAEFSLAMRSLADILLGRP